MFRTQALVLQGAGHGCAVLNDRYHLKHRKSKERHAMRRCAFAGAFLALVAFASPAAANKDVLEQTAKPEQWAIQTGDYANQRYSKLNQITRENVKNLKVAWTFSTGVLRGHEGSPLVVGDVMYVHTPFPNNI